MKFLFTYFLFIYLFVCFLGFFSLFSFNYILKVWGHARDRDVALTGVTCRGLLHPVCGMMHIKEPLLLISKSRPYLKPYNRK